MQEYKLESVEEKLNALNELITDEELSDGYEVASREIMDECVNYVIRRKREIKKDELTGVINDAIGRMRRMSAKLLEDHEGLSAYYESIAECMIQIGKIFA